MNPLSVIEKWISEHGSSSTLRDHVALLKEQMTALKEKVVSLEQENTALHREIKQLTTERDALKQNYEQLAKHIRNPSPHISHRSVRSQWLIDFWGYGWGDGMRNGDEQTKMRFKEVGVCAEAVNG